MANVTGVQTTRVRAARGDGAGVEAGGNTKTRTVSDGRAARSQRTRDAVVEALLDLLHDDPRPTAREIAVRAGVSLRSVYVHFDDLEDLFLAAAARLFEQIVPLLDVVPANGPLPARIEAFTSRQARLLEITGPVRHAANLQEPFSPVIAELASQVRERLLGELERVFGAELDDRPERERRHLLLALLQVSGGSAWTAFRAREGLDEAEAGAVMRETLTTLLGHRGRFGATSDRPEASDVPEEGS